MKKTNPQYMKIESTIGRRMRCYSCGSDLEIEGRNDIKYNLRHKRE
jgi:hypothetical protein